MSKLAWLPKSGWLVLVVVAIGVLMILPAGTVAAGRITSGSLAATANLVPATTGAPSSPSNSRLSALTPQSTPVSQMLSKLPPAVAQAPWVQSLAHEGRTLQPLTSLPNLALLEHPLSATTGSVNPFYVSQPAPLGLGDFGLGAKTYSYNTSHILGEVTFNTPPNVTDPASTGVTEVQGQSDGYVGSFHEFGIQLNTVATNISLPGSDQGFFWTQNVLNYNDTGIHFVSDTFNMTSATQNPYVIEPNTLLSACGYGPVRIQEVLFNYGGVFQCVGGTIPVSPASYPVTIQLYNNATTNAQNHSVISYGYRIIEAGTHQVFTGVSDQLVFNSPGAPHHAPPNPPGFSIDGFAPSPTGLFRDAEIVLVGNIGGDNSVFRAMSGVLQLEYSNASAGGWQAVPSAYNFGGDTGETSTGIADYWTASHTLVINSGPAMLYGLWNAVPHVSVRSGAIHLAGSITPAYGFVFVSNTAPVLNPGNASLGERDNMSWLPTTNAGTFSTWLPPLGAPWTTGYHVQAFAAGFSELNGSVVRGTDTSYNLHLASAPGQLRAPLYAFSNAQLASLAQNVTGESSSPYSFAYLTVNMNFTFEHVNDYGYAEFEVLMTQGVTTPYGVNTVYQGVDSSAGNFVFADYSLPTEQGILVPGPAIVEAPYWTSGINIFDGMNDLVQNQFTIEGGYNVQLVLWHDTGVAVENVTSEFESSGVWVGDSVGTTVANVEVLPFSTGVTDMGSFGTYAVYIGVDEGFGVVSFSSTLGTYGYIEVADDATAVAIGDDYGASADYVPYYYLPGDTDTVVGQIYAYEDSLGVNVSLSHHIDVFAVTARSGSEGVAVDDSSFVFVWYVTGRVDSTAVYFHHSFNVVAEHVLAVNYSLGVYVLVSHEVNIHDVVADKHSLGVYVDDSTDVTISDVKAYHHSIAIEIV
jgi:hypothetical protein